MKTVADVIDEFRGPSAFARVLGVGASTASEMKRRGSIPAQYWKRIVEVAAAQGLSGVSYQSLAEMHAAERAPTEGKAA